jgi:chromosome segregation ATPase
MYDSVTAQYLTEINEVKAALEVSKQEIGNLSAQLRAKEVILLKMADNLAHKDRMLEELGNINGKAVAEVAKLRKALEAIKDSRDRFEYFDGAGAATEAVRIAKEALA